MYVRHARPSAIAAQSSLQGYVPAAGEVLWEGIREGIRETSPAAAVVLGRDIVEQIRVASGDVPVLSEAEWKESPWHREGLRYPVNGLSETQAKVLAERRDASVRSGFLTERGGMLPFLAGTFIGQIPDPLNFVPFLGQASRAAAVARMGPRAGRAAAAATEAGAAALVLEPLLIQQADLHQEDRDWSHTALNVVASLAVGGAVGWGVGSLAKDSPLANLTTRQRVNGTLKAAADLSEVRPVDVAEVVGGARRPVREGDPPELSAAARMAAETPPEFRTPEQAALLEEIDPKATTEADWRVAPPERVEIDEPAEPTRPQNEGRHYREAVENEGLGEGEGILGAFFERSGGGREAGVSEPVRGAAGTAGAESAPRPSIAFGERIKPEAGGERIPVTLGEDTAPRLFIDKGPKDRSWRIVREPDGGQRQILDSGLDLRQAKANARNLLAEAGDEPGAPLPVAEAPAPVAALEAQAETALGRALEPGERAVLEAAEETAGGLTRRAAAYRSAVACIFGGG